MLHPSWRVILQSAFLLSLWWEEQHWQVVSPQCTSEEVGAMCKCSSHQTFPHFVKAVSKRAKCLWYFLGKEFGYLDFKWTKLAARNSKRYIFLLTFFFGEQCKRFYNFTMNGFKIYLQIIRWSSQRRNLIITPSPLFACRNHWLKSPKIYFSCNNLMYCVHQTRIISNVKMQQSIYCGISNYPLCIFSFWIKMTTIYMISTDIGMEIMLCNNIHGSRSGR